MMTRVTGPLIKVLNALLESPTEEKHGFEILRATKLRSGTLYPLLDRLERDGMLKGRWEDDSASKGPPWRFFRLTDAGIGDARQILAKYLVGWSKEGEFL
jgi:PadR family transcriptional regulator, regulatory protein PadR